MRKIILSFLVFFLTTANIANAGDTLRVMSYNLLNYGNITDYCNLINNSFVDKEKPLSRIFKYINPDIIGVCELGANSFVHQRLLDSTLNNDGQKHYAKANYSNQAGGDLVSMLFYNDQKLALRSQYVLNTVVRDIMMYKLYYLSPDLAQTHDTAFINCIVSHWKAGSATSDKNTRAQMTLNAMQWIEMYGGVGNYLFMGDFNVQTSSEQSFQNLVNYNVASLCFFDPINKLGTWNNSGAFSDYHTQSTHTSSNGCASTGGMDDRFDFILASASVINGTNHFQYLLSSYKAVGNDGNHFNQAINSGSNNSAPASIINDLYQMSDHLPIQLDLLINQQGAGFEELKLSSFTVQTNNPIDDYLQLILKSKESSNIKIELFSSSGIKIFDNQIQVNVDGYRDNISTLNWPSGIYFLCLTDQNGFRITKKLIKI